MIFLVKSTFCRQIHDPVRTRSDHSVPPGKFQEVHAYFGGSCRTSPYFVIFKEQWFKRWLGTIHLTCFVGFRIPILQSGTTPTRST